MYKRLFLASAAFSLLVGCGGGGSSTSGTPAYSGITTQATITTSNAKALSSDAYSGSMLSSGISGVAKEAGNNSGQSALLQETANILENSVRTIVATPKATAKVVAATAQNSVNGYSGSFSYSISYDQISGAFTGTITFLQYKETSTSGTLSGSITFSGVIIPATGKFASLTINISNVSGIDGSKSYRLDGVETYSNSGPTETVTMTVVLTDNVSGRTYWIKDFTLTLTGTSLSVAGTYYDPIYGYVVISTITPLTASTIDSTPTSGQLLFTGSNGTKVRLTFTSSGSTVEADTVGNGTYVVVP